MNREEIILKVEYLVEKYVPERKDLVELIKEDIDSVKYILAEIGRYKTREYDNNDKEIIKDIAFFYI